LNEGEKTKAFQDGKWKKGQSGNPAGRPKRKSLETVILDILEENIAQDPDEDGNEPEPMSKLEALGRIAVDEALANRNFKVMRELFMRLWPILSKHELTGAEGAPITLAELIKRAKEEE
jgi:hypothetical protein